MSKEPMILTYNGYARFAGIDKFSNKYAVVYTLNVLANFKECQDDEFLKELQLTLNNAAAQALNKYDEQKAAWKQQIENKIAELRGKCE